MESVRIFAALSLSLCAASTAASPISIPVGDTRVILDAPVGYADTTFTGSPRLQELAESLTSASNRVLLFAISDGDLRRFTLGEPPEFRRYMVVVTPKVGERERLTPAAFQRMVTDATQGFQAPPADAEITKLLEKQPVGQAMVLAELRKDSAVLSQLQGTRLPPTKIPGFFGSTERQNFMLSTSTMMLVRGKALNLAVFTLFDGADDVAWVRSMTLRWAEDLLKLNAR